MKYGFPGNNSRTKNVFLSMSGKSGGKKESP